MNKLVRRFEVYKGALDPKNPKGSVAFLDKVSTDVRRVSDHFKFPHLGNQIKMLYKVWPSNSHVDETPLNNIPNIDSVIEVAGDVNSSFWLTTRGIFSNKRDRELSPIINCEDIPSPDNTYHLSTFGMLRARAWALIEIEYHINCRKHPAYRHTEIFEDPVHIKVTEISTAQLVTRFEPENIWSTLLTHVDRMYRLEREKYESIKKIRESLEFDEMMLENFITTG